MGYGFINIFRCDQHTTTHEPKVTSHCTGAHQVLCVDNPQKLIQFQNIQIGEGKKNLLVLVSPLFFGYHIEEIRTYDHPCIYSAK